MPPDETPEVITILNCKGTAAFKAWLNEFSDFCHMNSSTLFGVALAAYASQVGFATPMPKRTGGRS